MGHGDEAKAPHGTKQREAEAAHNQLRLFVFVFVHGQGLKCK